MIQLRSVGKIGVGAVLGVIAMAWLLSSVVRRPGPETNATLTLLRASRLLETDGWMLVSDELDGSQLRFVIYERSVGDLRAGATLISPTDDRGALSDVWLWAYQRPDLSKDPALEFLCIEMASLIPDSAETLVALVTDLSEAPFEGGILHKTAIATTASGWELILMDYRRADALSKEGDSPRLYLDASR